MAKKCLIPILIRTKPIFCSEMDRAKDMCLVIRKVRGVAIVKNHLDSSKLGPIRMIKPLFLPLPFTLPMDETF